MSVQIDVSRVHVLDERDPAACDAFEPLLDVVGDARVVAVGEGAHFVSEYWQSRQHLIRFLNQRAGFHVVAMEFGIGEALEMAKWLDGEGAEDDLASVSPAASQWGAGEMRRWLRTYNSATAARGESPLAFAGIDLPSAGGSFAPALDPLDEYLRKVDPEMRPAFELVRSITDRIDSGSGVAAATRWSQLLPAERDSALSGLARIALRVAALTPHYETRSAALDHRTAVRLAQSGLATAYMLQATLSMATGGGLELDTSVRERFLADSVLDLIERSDDKIIVLAHNNHVQKTPITFAGKTYTLPMGLYLARSLGKDYRVIAQTTTDNHVPDMVLDPDSPVGFRVADQQLPPPPPGSFEHSLIATVPDRRSLTDVRPGRGVPALDGIRSQGGYVDTDVSEAFDAVVNHPRITQQAGLGF
jgi:erythromycin esterase